MQQQIINVLIIDDESELRKMLSTILIDEGYSVETAENGKQAIKTCKKT
jgi:CheY-like chemotaxis protein